MHERRPIDLGFDYECPLSGSHICYIYSDDRERMELLARFFDAGRRANEKLLYATDSMSPASTEAELKKQGFDFKQKEDYFVAGTDATYLADGTFSADRMLGMIRNFYLDALDDGFNGSRGTGEMNWASNHGLVDWDSVLEYECRLTETLEVFPYTAICQYDARQLSGELLFDVLRVHPLMIVQGQLVRNPYFIQPRDFLADHRTHHEQQVRSR